MKKIITFFSVLFLGTMLFALPYKIESVVGKVTYESPEGFIEVKAGDEFLGDEVIKTALNSSVVITFEGKTYTIKAKQSGSIESLFIKSAPTKNGLKKQTIAKSDAIDYAIGVREGVSTASSRASEAKEDFQWEE